MRRIGFGIAKESYFFAIILFAMTCYFLLWGLEYTNNNNSTVFVLATLFGVFMAFNIGGNDVANSFGTSVGAGTLTIKQALIVAAIFEVSGAMIAGGEVTSTIRKGIVDFSAIDVDPMQFVYIMMSALIGSAIWLLAATKRGWPVSTTHAIIGGIVGSSLALGFSVSSGDVALSMVKWDKIGTIALSWVISPLLGGLLSYGIYSFIKHFILKYNDVATDQLKIIKKEKKAFKKVHKVKLEAMSDHERIETLTEMANDVDAQTDEDFTPNDLESDYYKELYKIKHRRDNIKPYKALEVYLPLIAAFGSAIISAMVLFKGLKKLELDFSTLEHVLGMLMISAVVYMGTYIFARSMQGGNLERITFLLFSWLQVFTASGFAFSHGSNDIANAIGPFAAVIDVLKSGEVGSEAAIPPVAMLTFGVALIAGLWFIGKDVIKTVGHKLTEMHPASGFSAELGASAVILLASTSGIPVSSTHILIGAVLGIGLVNKNANWELMKPIASAWIITIPASALISIMFFFVLRSIF